MAADRPPPSLMRNAWTGPRKFVGRYNPGRSWPRNIEPAPVDPGRPSTWLHRQHEGEWPGPAPLTRYIVLNRAGHQACRPPSANGHEVPGRRIVVSAPIGRLAISPTGPLLDPSAATPVARRAHRRRMGAGAERVQPDEPARDSDPRDIGSVGEIVLPRVHPAQRPKRRWWGGGCCCKGQRARARRSKGKR